MPGATNDPAPTVGDGPLDAAAAMRLALAVSARVHGTTSPNPPVGDVVLVRDGRVAGTGATAPPGGPHAEVAALAAAGERARGGTAVVTLEPCAHHGRT
ncbi:bifunctional diaminohydroxyphosphoribosylaminopyrimidine deaminase/5-amino-6-(5-phosphoribosylamino)uracil reductase, partial [Pseudonocardia benzenivorans]